jgi:NarL family two-component system response regulator LiaR
MAMCVGTSIALVERTANARGNHTRGNPAASAAGQALVTRVLIVDDHPIVRSGIQLALLSCPEFTVVGEAGSGEEALRLVEQVRPDLILMDLVMPRMGGLSAIRAIRERVPDARILVLTSYEEGDTVQQALQAGAIGYQLKGVAMTELLEAIRLAAAGQSSLAPMAAQALVQATQQAPALGGDLTGRERAVLGLLIHGLSNKEIAERLVVTIATVKFHLRNIRLKLGATTRTQTVVMALRHRLIPSS